MALDETQNSSSVRLRPGARIGVVASTYHGELIDAMVRAARKELEAAGLAPKDLIVLSAPGAFELPLVARELARREDIDAVIAFGLVLKGETEHDRHISRAVAHACMDIGFQTGTPALFGVLTCNTVEQARARALSVEEGGIQNKGREVARACLEVLRGLDLARNLPTSGTRFSRMGDAESVTVFDTTKDQDDLS
jgi:6,7-dimethyl-8-ribityllumazine synthase